MSKHTTLPKRTDLVDGILDVIAHSCVAWTMGDCPEQEAFQDLKNVYRQLPGNRYKAEQIADWLETYRCK